MHVHIHTVYTYIYTYTYYLNIPCTHVYGSDIYMYIYLIFICIYIHIVTSIEFTARCLLDTNPLPSLHLYMHIPRTYIHKYICMTYHTHTRIYIYMCVYMYIIFFAQQGGNLPIPCPVRGSTGAGISYGGNGGVGGVPNSNIFFCTKVNVFFCNAKMKGPFTKVPCIFRVTNFRSCHALTGKIVGCTHGCTM